MACGENRTARRRSQVRTSTDLLSSEASVCCAAMKVELLDIRMGTQYIAEHVTDCQDSTDASVFREVLRCGDVVTMGMTVGRPIYDEAKATLTEAGKAFLDRDDNG